MTVVVIGILRVNIILCSLYAVSNIAMFDLTVYSPHSDATILTSLMLSMLGKKFSKVTLKPFLFLPGNRLWNFMRDNLEEMPKPIFWEK